MALEKIVIQVGGQADLDSTIKKLLELGVIDEKNAKAFQKNSKDIQASIDQNTSKLGAFDKALTNIGPLMAGAFAVSKIVSFGKEVIDITAKFQRFEAVLTNTLGSKSEAQKALTMIKNFAASTPFAVDELTDSFVKLANQGFKPTQDQMRKLGDLAASQGKSFSQLTEGLLDATTFQFERLKEFGIRAEQSGNKIKFTFKGVETTVDKTNQAVQKYILSLGDVAGVSGGMAAISQTLGGQISNLGDSFDSFLVAIGGRLAPIISGAISAFGGLLTGITSIIGANESATSSFNKQKEAVDNLEQNTVPLINRYEELSKKSSLSKDEQSELDKIIVQIGKDIPTAITQFDEYGKAIGISTEEARKFVDQQKAMLAFKNKEAIKETQQIIVELNGSIKGIQNTLNNGFRFESNGQFSKQVKLTGDEIVDLQAKLAELQTQKLGASGVLDELKGIKKEFKETPPLIQEEIKTIETLRNKIKDLTEERDKQTDISDPKRIASITREIEVIDQQIKALLGQDDATKQLIKSRKDYEEMQKRAQTNIKFDPILNPDLTKDSADKVHAERVKSMKAGMKIIDAEIKANQEADKKILEGIIKREAEIKQAKQIATDAGFNIANQALDFIQDNENRKADAQINAVNLAADSEIAILQRKRDKGRLTEEQFQVQREAILKKAARKEAEIKTKQAKDEKKFALITIALNTAIAVIKGISQFGPPPSPPGIAAIAAAIATGALQAAIVAATPIPAFKDGVIGYKGKGTETSDSNLVKISKGESVMTAKETRNYRAELEAMRKGTFEKYRLPVTRRKSLSEARHESMAENMFKSAQLQQGFNDSRIVSELKNKDFNIKNGNKLGSIIASKIGDKLSENSLYR